LIGSRKNKGSNAKKPIEEEYHDIKVIAERGWDRGTDGSGTHNA